MEAGKRFMDVNLSNLSFIQTPEKKTEKKTASPSSVMDVAPWHERDAPAAWYDSFLESTFTELHEPIISVESHESFLESSFTTEPTFSAFLNNAVTANHAAYVIQVAWHHWRKRKKAERRKQAKERAKMIEKKAEELVQLGAVGTLCPARHLLSVTANDVPKPHPSSPGTAADLADAQNTTWASQREFSRLDLKHHLS